MSRFATTLLAAGILASAFTLAAPALADDDDRCGRVPRADWLSVEEIARRATALGYNVRGLEADDGCWEVEARDGNGRKVELHLHPTTAEIVSTDFDD